MCDFFALNNDGPSYNCTTQEKNKWVQFIVGVHYSLFVIVAQICKEAKVIHDMIGYVPFILAKDETKAISYIFWDVQSKWIGELLWTKIKSCVHLYFWITHRKW